jgi:hypothetical protein
MSTDKKPEDPAREQRKLRRQAELEKQKELTYDEISEGSSIPVRVWERAVSLTYWEDSDFNIARDLDATELTTYFA